jgi:hypothetical protein
VRWLIACVLTFCSSIATANGPVYAEAQFAAAGVNHSGLDFYPQFASVSAGVFLRPGIGLEVFADGGLSADRKGGQQLEVENAFGVAIRLQSPPIRRVQGFVVSGAVNYSINPTAAAMGASGSSSIEGDFKGARISVGLMERLERWENVLLTLEYRHYNASDPLRVDALLLGLRFNTP